MIVLAIKMHFEKTILEQIRAAFGTFSCAKTRRHGICEKQSASDCLWKQWGVSVFMFPFLFLGEMGVVPKVSKGGLGEGAVDKRET